MPIARFQFSSKADVLTALAAHQDLGVPAVHVFTVAEWRADGGAVLRGIAGQFAPGTPLAIRSSCRREDSEETSGAGAYLSVLNVASQDGGALRDAIEGVIASYGQSALPEDQVLVQPMIPGVAVSGVMMTRTQADGTPYYVINYDDESGRTDTVTGGKNAAKTVYVYRGARDGDFDSPRLRGFVGLARRVEALCGNDALDIEFCQDSAGNLHLLQARPICSRRHWPGQPGDLAGFIGHVGEFIEAKTGPSPGLFGQRSILGVMPDWNPAEMIGLAPRPLASSLYRHLITADVWGEAREAMGYRPMPPTELMLLILGRPYIDVRASFNSFLPEGLDPVTCEALVSAWLERLETMPQLHDKVEFEIAQTVLDFSFDDDLAERFPGLLTSQRRYAFRAGLRALTQRCLDDSPSGSMAQALEAVTELRNRQAGRPLVGAGRPHSLSAVAGLLAECREYGTFPFSILARHGFIAEALLRSASRRGAISPERVREFKLSVKTVVGEMSDDFLDVCLGRRDGQAFMRKYGHLRPGSYDVLSPRYADRQGLFAAAQAAPERRETRAFGLSPGEAGDIDALLRQSGLDYSPERLLAYAARAIAGRELAKFVFSRNLSDVLEALALWGEGLGFSRDDVSFMNVQAILDQTVCALPEGPRSYFERHVAFNRELAGKGRAIKLGYLIRSLRDVYVVPQHRAAPNFIGSGAATGEVARLAADSPCTVDLAGKIVCIENADPGFDWVFTRGLAGLVTKFGGANSHMAIRCAEYGLPAAIGCGDKIFEAAASARRLALDCGAKSILPEKAI